MKDWNEIMSEVERISLIEKVLLRSDKGILLDEFRISHIGTWWVFYVNGEKKFIHHEIGITCNSLFEAIEKSVSDFKALEFQHKAFRKPYLNKRK